MISGNAIVEIASLKAQLGEYSKKLIDAANKIIALTARIEELDERCTRLAKACHEAARLGYQSGHNDTVEGVYSDPSEEASDICEEIFDNMEIKNDQNG